MIKAKYPIVGSKDFLEISIDQTEPYPESQHGDRRSRCKVLGPGYEKTFYSHGIDDFQCVWLALRRIRECVKEFEKKTKMKCEYHFFQEFEG